MLNLLKIAQIAQNCSKLLKIAQFTENSSKLPNMLKNLGLKYEQNIPTNMLYHFTVDCIEEDTAFTEARFYGVKGKPQMGPEDRYDQANDFHGCQDLCRKDNKCKYWTWTKKTDPGQCYGDWPCYGGCFLIAGQKTVIKDNRFVSGSIGEKCGI